MFCMASGHLEGPSYPQSVEAVLQIVTRHRVLDHSEHRMVANFRIFIEGGRTRNSTGTISVLHACRAGQGAPHRHAQQWHEC